MMSTLVWSALAAFSPPSVVVMPEIMSDDADLFNIVQSLVVVFPLFADHLACKGQFFFSLFTFHNLCSAV